MDNQEKVPYIVHEGIVARLERIIKRLTIALIVSLLLIFATNAIWIYYIGMYDFVSDTRQLVSVDGKDGIANYIGNDGSIVNGEDSGSDKAQDH